MRDTDRVQTWRARQQRPAGDDWGEIDCEITERIDLDARRGQGTRQGVHEGERVSESYSWEIHADVTPADAARYRRANGYTRIS